MSVNCPKGLKVEISHIIHAALNAVDPYQIIINRIKKEDNFLNICGERFDFDQISRVFLVGFGKAVLPMAKAILDEIRDELVDGILVPKHLDLNLVEQLSVKFKVLQGDHPIPTRRSVIAAEEIRKLLSQTTKNDLVVGLISGGGSSLVSLPIQPIEVNDLNRLTQALLRSGASINEINTVRKHMDQIKGGGLLRFLDPARSINLILSDVIGDDLSVIASGPTCLDPSTFLDAIIVLKRYDLWEKAPATIQKVFNKGIQGEISETVKNGDRLLEKTSNHIVGSLRIAAETAKLKAESRGFQYEVLDLELSGEARIVGKKLAQYLKERKIKINSLQTPLCIIAGGETTVTVSGNGKGGRNQELALAAALELDGIENVQIVTLATDGEDGPTDAAGACVDGQTIKRAKKMGLNARDYLLNNDAYNYFQQTGELIFTGPTGTNVNDLVFLFVYP